MMNDMLAADNDDQGNGSPAAQAADSEYDDTVFLKARILKEFTGFHKLVYGETVGQVNSLIESLVNRGKENQFKNNFKPQ